MVVTVSAKPINGIDKNTKGKFSRRVLGWKVIASSDYPKAMNSAINLKRD